MKKKIFHNDDSTKRIIPSTKEITSSTNQGKNSLDEVKNDGDAKDFLSLILEDNKKQKEVMDTLKECQPQAFMDLVLKYKPIEEDNQDKTVEQTISRLHFLTSIFENSAPAQRLTFLDYVLQNELVEGRHCLLMAVVSKDDHMKKHCWKMGITTNAKHYDVFYDIIGSRMHTYPKSEHHNNKDDFFAQQEKYHSFFTLNTSLPEKDKESKKNKI